MMCSMFGAVPLTSDAQLQLARFPKEIAKRSAWITMLPYENAYPLRGGAMR